MEKLITPLVLLVVLVIVIKILTHSSGRKPVFEYRRKDGLMTRAEQECFNALMSEMGTDYHFFPQIHLDALVSSTSSPRNRLYAFRHINQKSVDFVACDKQQFRPLFAIELDDKTHGEARRRERDKEVERILRGAGIPLIRVQNRGRFEPKELAQQILNGIDEFARRPVV